MRSIAVYFLVALVSFAHLSYQVPVSDTLLSDEAGFPDGSGQHLKDGKVFQFHAAEPRSQSSQFQTNCKLPAPVHPSGLTRNFEFPALDFLSNLFYFKHENTLLRGLESFDIIFPFHTFW